MTNLQADYAKRDELRRKVVQARAGRLRVVERWFAALRKAKS